MSTNERKGKEKVSLIQEVSEVNLLNSCATFEKKICNPLSSDAECIKIALHCEY